MGYCYSADGRLVCDSCGADRGVRKRKCVAMVTDARGFKLPYCYPPAYCGTCFASKGGNKVIHKECHEGAAKRNAKEQEIALRLADGDSQVVAAFGDWHRNVPTGYVGVLVRGSTEDLYILVTSSQYKGGWLSDYPDAKPWIGPNAESVESAVDYQNLIGAHVTYFHDGRELLGEVVGAEGALIKVKHFNGEPWPVNPRADMVSVLERSYAPGEES